MFEFDEYCEVFDYLNARGLLPDGNRYAATGESRQTRKLGNADARMSLCCYLAANELSDDDAYFDILIRQSDLETLTKLRPYFAEGTSTAERIQQRIEMLLRLDRGAAQSPGRDRTEETPFYLYLCRWIDKKGFQSDADFYNAAGISRQVFCKMRNNRYSITREMALHLAVALTLDDKECTEFLRQVGYALNRNSRREQIISFMMRKRRYTFREVEELLELFHEKTFLDAD